MKKCLMLLSVATLAVAMLAGCGKDVKGDAKPAVDLALREFGVPAQCLEIKDVKDVKNEQDSFTATAVCEINGEKQSGDISVKYKDGKPEVNVLGFGYPEVMTVKRGVLGIDASRTVADALSSNLDDLKWEYYLNKRNQGVVKATGIWKGDTLSFEKEYSYNRWMRTFTVVKPGKKVDVYFVLNRDGSFAFATGEISSNAKDLGFLTEPDDGLVDKVTPEDLKTLKGGFLAVLYH